ncbi:MAG: TIGR00341 family protein [Halobacteriales archaeon]|nr:TIGR00341 family protein [Halobacteriales archaeon]
MRFIQVTTPDDKYEDVTRILEEADVEFSVVEEASDRRYSHIFSIPTKTDEVEGILDSLREAGVGDEGEGHVVVSEAQAIVSEEFEEEEEEEGEAEDEEEEENGSTGRIARDELKATARGLSRSTPNYVIFTVVSAVVATAGLIQNSPSVVVGSMVIAPLIGPAMAASVGSVINDDKLFRDGVKAQFIGVFVSIAAATVFAVVARLVVAPELDLLLIQQISERVNPGLLALGIALGAGVAGALSLTSGASAALVGVMIAVALIPPAATVGLGIAYIRPAVAGSAFVLTLVNLLSISMASLVTLWAKGYRPEKWYEEKHARRDTLRRVGILFVGVVVLTGFLVTATVDQRANTSFEDEVERVVEGFDADASVEYEYTTGFFSTTPERVTVRTGEGVSADEVARRIEAETGASVEVVVVRQETERARP